MRSAFTLLEIMIVMVVIGIIATMALPRLTRKDPSSNWTTVLDEINNLVFYARQDAISNYKNYQLRFTGKVIKPDKVTIEEEKASAEDPSKNIFVPAQAFGFATSYSLPKTISIEAVYHNKTEEMEDNKGNGYCHIIPNGLVQKTTVHLSRTEKNTTSKISLRMMPFFGKFEILEGFVRP